MARLARVVIRDVPHHITQRGNRRQPTFFCDEDYAAYLALLHTHCAAANVGIWAYCLMPNHVHLILVPHSADGLRAGLADAHRRYSRMVNARQGWRGYLWQGRFASVAMEARHLIACSRYVEQNPVRAGLVAAAEDWPWSSARAHLAGQGDGVVDPQPLLDMVEDWRAHLSAELAPADHATLKRGERTGRPIGSPAFLQAIEQQTGRCLAKQRPGPKCRPPVTPAA